MPASEDPIILVVGGSASVLSAAADTGRAVVEAATAEEGVVSIRRWTPSLIVLQTSRRHAVEQAEALLDAALTVALLVLLPENELPRFQAGLPFMPRLGKAWTGSADASADELANLIAAASETGRKRRESDGILARINASLTRRPDGPKEVQRQQDRLSERYFTTLLSTAPDAFLAIDLHGRILALNDAGAALFGIGDVLGEASLADLIAPTAAGHFADLLARARSGEIVRQVDLPLAGVMSEKPRWIEISLAPVADDQDIVESLSATARDVSERRAADAALVESRERLRFAMEAAGQGAWELDLAERRLTASPHCRANFGRDPDAPFTYDDLLDCVHPDDRARMQAAVAQSIASGETYDIEYRCTFPDGRIGWVHVAGRPTYAADGAPLMMLGVSSDITARKRAEEELIALNERLEERVAAVVAEREFAQEALRQSQKMEAMGQLTGGVAHDFNNLLTPIIGSLDLLQRRGTLTEREARLIDGALQSAERAKTLVQRLLAFARRQPLRATAVDVGDLLRGMAELIGSTSGPQIRITTAIAEHLPSAMADANQLEMAVLNLAVNARDAMPDGGTLTISAEVAVAPLTLEAPIRGASAMRLGVADTGSGMDAQTLKRAIEPFYSTKGVGKGTGLGLSMVHGLAQQLGGGMTIASRVGLGTRIDIWLPLSATQAVEVETTPAVSDKHFRGRALVVDDEAIVRLTTSGMLESMGFEISEAESATEAERRLHAGERYDLVVTDHLMPGLSGAAFAQNIRRTWPETRVLIVSGYAEVDGIAPDLPRLAKPFREAELAEAVSALG